MTNLKDRKIGDAIARILDTLEMDMEWIPYLFANHHGTAMQMRMHNLCMSFIRHWSNRFASGDIAANQVLYDVCKQCHSMTTALDNAAQAEYNSPRARRLRLLAEKSS